MLESLKRTIARVEFDGRSNGTAFIVDRKHAVTALHVLDRRSTVDLVFVEWPGADRKRVATRTWRHPAYDVAILELNRECPSGVQPLPWSTTPVTGDRWSTFGFPAQVPDGHPLVDERINDPSLLIEELELRILHLHTLEAQYDLGGFSGAPCVVGGAIVGVVAYQLCRTPPDGDSQTVREPSLHTLYALPIALLVGSGIAIKWSRTPQIDVGDGSARLAPTRDKLAAPEGDVWSHLDGPPGGIVRCLAADPFRSGRLLAGDYQGGVALSHDHGRSWTRVGLEDVRIAAIAFSPSTRDQVWAVGDVGAFLSEEPGWTWQQQIFDSDCRAVAYLPSGDRVLGEGRSWSGVRVGSGTGIALAPPSPSARRFVERGTSASAHLRVEHLDGTRTSYELSNINAIAVRGDGAYIVGTSESGAVIHFPGDEPYWIPGIPERPIFAVAWMSSGRIAVGGRGFLTITTPAGEPCIVEGIDPHDEVTSLLESAEGLWVGTHRGVAVVSPSGDLSWRCEGLARVGAQSLLHSGGALLAGSNGHGVFEWRAGEGRWHHVAPIRRAGAIPVVGSHHSSTLLVGSNMGGLYKTDGASRWTLLDACDAHFFAGVIVPATRPSGGLTISDGRGNNERSMFARPGSLEPERWIVGTQEGEVRWSLDLGTSWKSVRIGLHGGAHVYDLAWIDGRVLVAAWRDGLWLVDLATGAAMPHPTISLAMASAIGCDASNRMCWLGGARDHTEVGLYRVRSDASLEPAMTEAGPVWSVLATKRHLVVGTANGIRVSSDGGTTWTTPTGSPDGPVGQIVPHTSGILVASTERDGVFTSTDDGCTWTRAVEGMGTGRKFGWATRSGSAIVIAGADGVFRRRFSVEPR